MKKPSPRRSTLPAKPSLEHLRKQAKQRAKENPPLKLAAAQQQLAREYGFQNWAEMAREVEALARGAGSKKTVFEAILRGDVTEAEKLLGRWPALLDVDLWPVAMFQASDREMTRLLLRLGLNPNRCSAPRKPLHFACEKGWPEIVEELLRHGADPDIRDGEGFTPLDLLGTRRATEAAQSSMRILRGAGAEVTVWTAIRIGDSERALSLLGENPELVNAPSPDLGFTPLQTAARAADLRLVRWLLERGAAVNARNPMGNTSLWFACQSGEEAAARLAIARELIAAGAEIDRRCEEGTTALSYAAWRGPAALVGLLLAHGADPELGSEKGERPLDHARRGPNASERDEIVRLLTEAVETRAANSGGGPRSRRG